MKWVGQWLLYRAKCNAYTFTTLSSEPCLRKQGELCENKVPSCHISPFCIHLYKKERTQKVPFFRFVGYCVWTERLCFEELWRQDEVTVISRRHVGCIILFILNLGSRWTWLVKCTHQVLCSWGKSLIKYRLNWRQRWIAQPPIWILARIRNILPSCNGSQILQSSKP